MGQKMLPVGSRADLLYLPSHFDESHRALFFFFLRLGRLWRLNCPKLAGVQRDVHQGEGQITLSQCHSLQRRRVPHLALPGWRPGQPANQPTSQRAYRSELALLRAYKQGFAQRSPSGIWGGGVGRGRPIRKGPQELFHQGRRCHLYNMCECDACFRPYWYSREDAGFRKVKNLV